MKVKSLTKRCYWEKIEKRKPTQTQRILWEKDLEITITEEEWKNMYIKTFGITNDTKIRYFQYRVINRILTTNTSRSKYTDISEKCQFCDEEKETVIHILCDCKKVKKLWLCLEKWCEYFFKTKVRFTNRMIIFNEYSGKQKTFVNSLILYLKRYIYIYICKQMYRRNTKFLEFSTKYK